MFFDSLLEVFSYATSPFLLAGAWMAIKITVLALIGGLVLGLALALMRISSNSLLSSIAWIYIFIFRGTPIILQLVFLFDVLPAVGIKLSSFTTAVLGFALNEAAYAAEIIRGGIISVDRRQKLAAQSFGMSGWLTLRRIVLPQALRSIVPAMTNQMISMIKGTSVTSVIFVNELTFRSQQIVSENFKFFTVFTAAGLIYLALTGAISSVQYYIERHYNLEIDRQPGAHGFLSRFFGFRPPSNPVPTVISDADAGWLSELVQARPSAADRSQESFVVCRDVRKFYSGREILGGINIEVKRGEVVVLMGPSGSGKSTLLRLINHLEPMDGGEIKVDGSYVGYAKNRRGVLKPVSDLAGARARARIGMVFQHFNLFEHLTAIENVIEAPVQVYGEDPAAARHRAIKLLDLVGLAQHADKLPHRLSGGQQQRVAIARALAITPKLILFDEPTSSLDPELVGEVLSGIRKLADAGLTMVIVTHEVRFARDVADRVVFMDGGQVVEEGPPAQVIDAPVHERTRRFLRMVAQQT